MIGGNAGGVSVFACPVLKLGTFVLSDGCHNELPREQARSVAGAQDPRGAGGGGEAAGGASDLQGEAFGAKEEAAKATFINEMVPAWIKHFEKMCSNVPTAASVFLCGTSSPQACSYVLVTALNTISRASGAPR